ncbi:type II toxin-antitoxin system mRNA interferase toxin, RelE/StbE family [Candidatus Gracilibacteria bacterium]|nr:type II toxin-antitoxin system mRNA interferase toxin, RelE/StbE family [Candidatus Gracilibacteria bacterium]
MKILTKSSFDKSYQKLQKRDQIAVDNTIALFIQNPRDEKLRNHVLKGALEGLRSIDVKNDLRIIFEEMSDGRYELVSLNNVGSHSQLY